jgi:hypothetical protein
MMSEEPAVSNSEICSTVSPLVSIAPSGELTDTRLQHLVRMEACIFAQYRTRERRD